MKSPLSTLYGTALQWLSIDRPLIERRFYHPRAYQMPLRTHVRQPEILYQWRVASTSEPLL